MLQKIINLFCYCGVSKEEYNSVKKQAYMSNFALWKYMHAIISAIYLVLSIASIITGDAIGGIISKFIMCVYCLIIFFVLTFVFKKDSFVAQLIIYLTMIFLFMHGLYDSIMQPFFPAITFMILLVILPMFMIDKPYYMTILLVCSSAVFIYHSHVFKTGEILKQDYVNCILYCALGIFINVFYNMLRIQEFILEKKEKLLLKETEEANEKTIQLNGTLVKMSESVLDLLGDIVDFRDQESGEHIHRVRGFTNILAKEVQKELPEYKLSDYDIQLITFTSVLHDVGKISISDSILLKPGKLTSDEFEIMKTHCEKGCVILDKMRGKWSEEYLSTAKEICLYHHEKWDGKGYPKGLKGDEIPISAQIVSIADIYDALTTKRVYKDAYSSDVAFDMIMKGECGEFSEKLKKCFYACKRAYEDYVKDPTQYSFEDRKLEISTNEKNMSIVVGLHDGQKTLEEKNKLSEELFIINALSESFCFLSYVNLKTNEMVNIKSCEEFEELLFDVDKELNLNYQFDFMLNKLVYHADYEKFRQITNRERAMDELYKNNRLTVYFRGIVHTGLHYYKLKMVLNESNPDAVIIGIKCRDEEHNMKAENIKVLTELESSRKELENLNKLEDRLAVIMALGSQYDFLCTLNVSTLNITVYHSEKWLTDMFENINDIITSEEARNETLRDIIPREDYPAFAEASRHITVMDNLMKYGEYTVNYRAMKYGKLINYQTRYTIDKNNPTRIIVGLHEV